MNVVVEDKHVFNLEPRRNDWQKEMKTVIVISPMVTVMIELTIARQAHLVLTTTLSNRYIPFY